MNVTACLEIINNRLKELPLNQEPKNLYEPMEYMLCLEPQRLYSLLTLWGCYLFSGDYQKAVTPSLGVEVFFNFLRLHSDLLDDNRQHSGIESVPVKWNRNVAILSGDAMIFKAYELLIQVEPHLVKPVVKKFNHCFTKVCEGKQLLLNEHGKTPDPEILHQRPGSLGEFSLQLGAMIARADPEQLDQTGRLGTEVAVCITSSGRDRLNHSFAHSLSRLRCPQDRKQEFEQWLNVISNF